jgi:hypothetical protein
MVNGKFGDVDVWRYVSAYLSGSLGHEGVIFF